MNTIKCERCNKDFISEEFDNHHCMLQLIDVQEIGINSIFKGNFQENGDDVWIVQGLNGIMYRLVQCSHNPPHPNTYPTVFDKNKNRRRLDRTSFEVLGNL
ncbi:MAG: hypothetical protein ACRDFB_08225 [Rhabdochlamydiaceae bacterium]